MTLPYDQLLSYVFLLVWSNYPIAFQARDVKKSYIGSALPVKLYMRTSTEAEMQILLSGFLTGLNF